MSDLENPMGSGPGTDYEKRVDALRQRMLNNAMGFIAKIDPRLRVEAMPGKNQVRFYCLDEKGERIKDHLTWEDGFGKDFPDKPDVEIEAFFSGGFEEKCRKMFESKKAKYITHRAELAVNVGHEMAKSGEIALFFKSVPLNKKMPPGEAIRVLSTFHNSTPAQVVDAFMNLRGFNEGTVEFRESVNGGYACIVMEGCTPEGKFAWRHLLDQFSGQPQPFTG